MSDTLKSLLQLKTPIIWASTNEALAVIDTIADLTTRPTFRMDVIEGLLTFDQDHWVKVLVKNVEHDPDNPQSGPEMIEVHSFQEGMIYVLENKGILIIENAHTMIEPITAFLNHITEKWYRGINEDDTDKMVASVVLISHKMEVPDEFKRVAIRYEHPLPSEQELGNIVTKMVRQANIPHIRRRERTKITRAGVGMTKLEFLHSAAGSLADHGTVDPTVINTAKLRILEADGVLSLRIPKITMDQIGGMDRAKHIMDRTTWIWQNPEEAKRLEIEPLRRILFIGISGSGKSALAEAAASQLGLELAKFGVGAMMSKFIGESENNMRRAFKQVEAMQPLCLWIDELGRDFSGSESSGAVDAGTTDRVHGELLQGLQELPEKVFLVCAANRIDNLPPEMLRADRFDKIMFIGFPTLSERMDIFRIHLGGQANKYDLGALATATEKFTGAEIKALVKEARFEVSASLYRPPTTDEIINISQTMKGLVWNKHREAIQDMYKKARNEWEWVSDGQLEEAIAETKIKSSKRTPKERTVTSLDTEGNIFK